MNRTNIPLRTKDAARKICLDWVCPICGKKGSSLPIVENYSSVTVSCKSGINTLHASYSVAFDPKLTQEEKSKDCIRLDLNNKLAETVRNAPPGTSVDDIWEEFVQKYNPPDWYEERTHQ